MAKGRFGNDKAPRRGYRGYIWLVAAVLAVALAGLGLEHGGGSPTSSLNGVLSAANQPAPAKNKANGPKNANGPENEAQAQANGSDDQGHTTSDGDCDSPVDKDAAGNCIPKQGHGPKNPPPPKCKMQHDDEKAEDQSGTQESKADEKAEQQQAKQDKKTCEMSAHHHPKPPKKH